MAFAKKNYVRRTIERLLGILEGITIDYEINDEEIIALRKWLDTHAPLIHLKPFNELSLLLWKILEDGVIEEHEREELLEWCSETINNHGFLEDFTQIVRRLHGIISGALSDNIITVDELKGLNDWMMDYEHLNDFWSFNDLRKLIKKVLKDGIIDDEEQVLLKDFFKDFIEQSIENPIIHDEEYMSELYVISPSPIFKPLSSICDNDPTIIFKKRKFCFTGPAVTGKRTDLHAIVENLGGIPQKNVVKDLDYLVIGGQSSPAWIYSTYGRKIESAIQIREKYGKICIIREYDFSKAINDTGKIEISLGKK